MSNLPLILFLVLFFIIVVPISVLIIVLVIKNKNQSWKGEIIDKLISNKKDFDTDREETFYTVKIKIDTGKEFNMAVDKNRYDQLNKGDRLEKVKGENSPKKIS